MENLTTGNRVLPRRNFVLDTGSGGHAVAVAEQVMSKWTFHVEGNIDGELASGEPIHVTPSPIHSLYSTTDASEARYLNGHPKAVLVNFESNSSPAPSLTRTNGGK